MLQQIAEYHYGKMGKNCAEAVLLAANEVYDTEFSAEEVQLFLGFGGGMGCKSTCGALTAAIAVLSKKYSQRPDFRDVCGKFVEVFREKLGCNTIDCGPLEEHYRTDKDRCVKTVGMAAAALEGYIDELDGKKKKSTQNGSGCTLLPEEIKKAKGMGFLNQKGTNRFNARIITRNGRISTKESEVIAEAAKKYGDGYMMMTTRLTVEVSGIEYDQIEEFCEFIGQAGLETGGTGSKVRPVVSCKGTTCQYGLYDTYELSEEIHERFYKGYRQVDLPHKFKIALGGCPNNCVKPNLNDLGVVGAKVPQYDESICRGCKVCQVEVNCPMNAAKMVDGKMQIDRQLCNNCGRAIGKCPFHCLDDGINGYRIYVGGRWGKKVAHGKMLSKVFTDKQQVLDTIEKAILLFRSEGISGERFADTIDRIGFERAEELLLGDELLEKKDEILGLQVVGGASC